MAHQVIEALALFAEAVRHRDFHVFKNEFGGILGVQTDLFQAAAPRKALHSPLDHQQTYRLMAQGRVGAGLGNYNHQVAQDAVSDKGFLSVKDIGVALSPGVGPNRGQVAPGVWLGHGDSRDRFPATNPRHPAGFLFLGGVDEIVGEANVVMETNPGTEAGRPDPL